MWKNNPWHEALLLDTLKLLGAQVLLLASRRVLHGQATQLLFSHIAVCEIQSPELSQSLAAEPYLFKLGSGVRLRFHSVLKYENNCNMCDGQGRGEQ